MMFEHGFWRSGAPVTVVAVAALAVATPLSSQETTRMMVRVTASDAKIIGSGVGGARVTVTNAQTGEVLAEGIQEGGTGDTSLIMSSPRERGATVYDTEGAAGFLAELELSEPTVVEIVAEGPLGTPDDLRSARRSLLVMPGEDILGEGVVLELSGFTVQMELPEEEPRAGEPFEVRGRITMLCGCPTQPGGIWDSDDYRILVEARRGGDVIGSWPMAFAGETSWYSASLEIAERGDVELRLLAMDPAKGNFGMAERSVTIR